jgi:DNA-binding NarL/FixJ family response regulator
MGFSSTRVVVYDNSSLQCELLATGLKSLGLQLELVCVNDLDSLNTVLTSDTNCVVIISDASMNGSPISVGRHLRACFAGLPFIILLQEGRHDRVIEAFRTGARGTVYSTANLSQLAKCIECVSHGEVWVRRAELAMIFEGLLKSNSRVTDVTGKTLLSPREEEISQLVAEGMSNREVSRTLKISESTVKNSLFHIFEKLGISNRVELARYVNQASEMEESALRERRGTVA